MTLPNNRQNNKVNGLLYETDAGYPWEKIVKTDITEGIDKQESAQTDQAYGYDLDWYLKIFGWPVFVFVILTILLDYLYRRYFPLWPESSVNWIFFGFRSLMYLIISLTAFYKYKTVLAQAMVSNISGSFIAGVIISIFQLFWYGSLWTIINLISLPLLMIFESIIYLIIIYGIYYLSNKN